MKSAKPVAQALKKQAVAKAMRKGDRPLVCFDESPTQLIGEAPQSYPSQAGPTRALRLRVSAQRNYQPLHLSRRASTVAQSEGHRPTGGAGFCGVHGAGSIRAEPVGGVFIMMADERLSTISPPAEADQISCAALPAQMTLG